MRDRGPRHTEKRKMCYRCGVRTVHVYDHGEKMHLCTECEL